MKRTLLALASVFAAVGVMAQATSTKGLLSFKSYYGASNNLKITASDSSPISTAAGWKAALLVEVGGTYVAAAGYPVNSDGTLGALAPVVANFNGTTGYVTAGGTWALEGLSQGGTYNFAVGAFYNAATWGDAGLKGYSMVPGGVKLGGNDLNPPVTAPGLAFGGATSYVVPVPEPSVIALGVLGLGAFLLRRRS